VKLAITENLDLSTLIDGTLRPLGRASSRDPTITFIAIAPVTIKYDHQNPSFVSNDSPAASKATKENQITEKSVRFILSLFFFLCQKI
jgi:hypothetical protein